MNTQRVTTREMYDSLLKKELTMADVSLIMSEVRKLIDEIPIWKENFRLLHFYCDWSQHNQIDRSDGCVRLITELNRCMWQINESGQYDNEINMDVSAFFRISQMLQELGLVLSSTFAKRIIPTLTFAKSLFNYLSDIPIVPVDAYNGRLNHKSKEYKQLCEKFGVGTQERPLIKNITIKGVEDNRLIYHCEMDNVDTQIKGIVDLPVCTDCPFDVMEIGDNSRQKFYDRLNSNFVQAMQFTHNGALQDAYNLLLKILHDLEGVSGFDTLRNNVNLHCFEVGWAFTGNPEVFKYGEEAAKTTTDCTRSAPIYHNLALYSLQKNMLDKADEYLDKGMECAMANFDKAALLHLKGKILIKRKDYDAAYETLTKAEEYSEMSHIDFRRIRIIINIADVLFEKHLPNMAISELNRAEQLAYDIHNLDNVIRCKVRKSQIYYSINDNENGKKIIESIPKQLD